MNLVGLAATVMPTAIPTAMLTAVLTALRKRRFLAQAASTSPDPSLSHAGEA